MSTVLGGRANPSGDGYPVAAGLLRSNDEAYLALLDRVICIDAARTPERAAQAVESAARLASSFHTGRFADGRLEEVTRRIGEGLRSLAPTQPPRLPPIAAGRRRILHVATAVQEVGGLTRMLERWIAADVESVHLLALLHQGSAPIPAWLRAGVESSGGTLLLPATSSRVEKAAWLRALARKAADLVVLHHHPWDVVPSIALATDDLPPVAVLNHADHVFWLGSSIADTSIDLRSAANPFTIERRFISDPVTLPIPLLPPRPLDRRAARRELQIREDEVVLTSVARAEKFLPSGRFDFLSTTRRLLERNPRAHLYLIGASEEDLGPFLRAPLHERLHPVGEVPDPSIWHAAADLYLESFPFGSQTSLLEAALAGLPVVAAWAPIFPLLVTNDDSLLGLVENAPDEAGYLARAQALIDDPVERRAFGARLRSRLIADHVGAGFVRHLQAVYRHTDGLRHQVRTIPATDCDPSPGDRGLATWRILAERDLRHAPDAFSQPHLVEVHAGQVARMFGQWGAARRHALRAVLRMPASVRTWRLLALASLGPAPGWARRLRRR